MDAQVPFTARVLDVDNQAPTGVQKAPNSISSLLPATHRTKDDHIITPQLTVKFLEHELLVKRLNTVQTWLWVCGRPMPARPLHHQIVLSRDITITESIELHLVWSEKRIFIKPIPRYLLDPEFWSNHLLPPEYLTGKQSDTQQYELLGCALGFMFSYTALIAYESDFRIAIEKGLLPEAVTWAGWKQLSAQLLESHCYASVNPRYWYGELRLARLNIIFRFHASSVLRGYSQVSGYVSYGERFRSNFGTLAAVFAYVAIVLTAMQVGLATEKLQRDEAFQRASYGFTVFSIIAPLIIVLVMASLILALFIGNWRATKAYERARFRDMGVQRFSEKITPSREKSVDESS